MDIALIHRTIRNVVQSYLPDAQVWLFGSHARGDFDNSSDYDLLIITPLTFTVEEKIHWSTKLDRAIVKAIRKPVDILINSKEEVRQKQELPGHIIRSAIKEGVML